MKHNALILTAALLLHTVVYAGNPNTLIRNAVNNPNFSGQDLITLCGQINISDVEGSPQYDAFTAKFNAPLATACSADALTELNTLIAAANQYNSAKSDTNAQAFLNAAIAYNEFFNPALLYEALLTEANTQVATLNAANATAAAAAARNPGTVASRASALNNIVDEATNFAPDYARDPNGDVIPDQVVRDIRNGFNTFERTINIDRNTTFLPNWLTEINTQLQDYNNTITNANWTLNGYAYVPRNSLRQNVDDALAQAQNRIAAGGAGCTPAQMNTLNAIGAEALRFNNENSDRFIANVSGLLNTLTGDPLRMNLGNDSGAFFDNLVSYVTASIDAINFLTSRSTRGSQPVAGFNYNTRQTMTANLTAFQAAVTTAAGGPAPAAPAADSATLAAARTAFIQAVAAHNAAVDAQEINNNPDGTALRNATYPPYTGPYQEFGMRALFRQASAGGPGQFYVHKTLLNSPNTQGPYTARVAPLLRDTYRSLANNARNLYALQQALGVTLPAGIKTIVNDPALRTGTPASDDVVTQLTNTAVTDAQIDFSNAIESVNGPFPTTFLQFNVYVCTYPTA